MKLPVYNNYRSERLAYVNPSTYSAEGQAWAQAFDTLGRSATQIMAVKSQADRRSESERRRIANEQKRTQKEAEQAKRAYDRQEANRLGVEADTRIQETLAVFDSEHAESVEFENADIPEQVRKQLRLPAEGTSPAYKSYAYWRKFMLDNAIKEEAKSIPYAQYQDLWKAKQFRASASIFHKGILAQSKQQAAYMKGLVLQNIEQKRSTGNYAGALKDIESYPGTDVEKRELQNKVKGWEQKDNLDSGLYPAYENQSQEEYLAQVTDTFNKLLDSDPETVGFIPEQRDTYMSVYQQKMHSISSNLHNTDVGQRRMALYKYDQVYTSIEDGQKIAPEEIQETIDQMTQYEHPEKVAQLKELMTFVDLRNTIYSSEDPQEIVKVHTGVRDKDVAPAIGVMNSKIIAYGKTVAIPMLEQDSIKYLKVHKVMDLPDMDYSSEESIQASFAKRKVAMALVAEKFNKSPEPLSHQEAQELNDQLSEMNMDRKMAFIQSVHMDNSLGDQAYRLWDQMHKYGYGAVTTAAGAVAAEGNFGIAKHILEGEKWQRTGDPKKTLVTTEDTDLLNDILIDQAFGIDITPEQRAQTELSARALLTYYVAKGRAPDDSLMKQVVTEITGGTQEVNGVWVRNPDRDKHTNFLEDWFKDLAPEYYKGIQEDYPPEQVKDGIDSGILHIRPTGLRGEYYIEDSRTGLLLKDSTGTVAYRLHYVSFPKETIKNMKAELLDTGDDTLF